MQIQKLTLEQFGSSTFLKEYARGSDSLANFYSFYPLHNNRIEELYKNRIRSIEGSFKKERIGIVSALQSFHATLGIDEEQREIREKLLRDDCFCVVTGQQLAWYGGPLYTFFKVISTILKAREISKFTGKTIIPVFWLADEDHDYDEIILIGSGKGVTSVSKINDLKWKRRKTNCYTKLNKIYNSLV